ncbi:hypothetical protein HOE22_07260 [Candidatus Woesearchaeota archaeon]|jgi:hypothetical protein|nr:hypothetical protein [Candidatus Woesearchaeota archaeon]
MSSWDTVENRIKIDTRFRLNVTDYISKIYSTRKKSILPWDINTEDVFEMLQELKWDSEQKFVVLFNFEFVMCLLKLGVSPLRITYIAPSQESFIEVRDMGWGENGMKSILFDLAIYKRHKQYKKWKKYLMKKLENKTDYIVVGNIPFTINKSDKYTEGGSPIKIGNDFVTLINQLSIDGSAVYILQAKFDTKTFKGEELIKNPNLQKIVYHRKPIFDNIAWSIHTCHVLLESETPTNKFIYSFNDTSDEIKLNRMKPICLGRTLDDTYYLDTSKKTLGNLWILGKKYLNQLDHKGDNKVITTLGSYKNDDFEWELDSSEITTKGQWKVILPKNQSGWAIKIAGPEYSISASIVGLVVKDKQTALNLKDWMVSENIINRLSKIRSSFVNSKTAFSKIELPDGLI